MMRKYGSAGHLGLTSEASEREGRDSLVWYSDFRWYSRAGEAVLSAALPRKRELREGSPARGWRSVGPVSPSLLQELFASGKVTPSTRVRTKGSGWMTLEKFLGGRLSVYPPIRVRSGGRCMA